MNVSISQYSSKFSPLSRWVILCLVLLVPFLIITWEYFTRGFTADTSGVTYVIIGLFTFGFFSSMRNALWIAKEGKCLREINQSRIPYKDKGALHRLFYEANYALEKGDQIDFTVLLTAYSAKQTGRIRSVSVTAGILITAGLLGTIIGLILTINGISSVLGAAGENYDSMILGLNETLQGMGTAFYTTFFGGLLGGVVLKALAAENEKAANRLTADSLELGEIWLMPTSRALASKIAANLQHEVLGLMNTLRSLSEGITQTSEVIETHKSMMDRQFSNLIAEAKIEMTQSLQAGLDEMLKGFEAIVQTIETGHDPIKKKMQELSEAIGTAASATSNAVEETNNAKNKVLDGRALELANKLNTAAELIAHMLDKMLNS